MKRSRFGDGAWVIVVGAGLFALGCGRLALLLAQGTAIGDATAVALAAPGPRLVTPIIVLVAGVLIFVAGPRLVPAFRTSLVGRGVVAVIGVSEAGDATGASAARPRQSVDLTGGRSGAQRFGWRRSWRRLAGRRLV